MENDSWRQILGKKKEKAPACIEVLRNLQGSDLTIERVAVNTHKLIFL
jgi:hypothetical protein